MSRYSDIKKLKEEIKYAKLALEWHNPLQDKEQWEFLTKKIKEHERKLDKLTEDIEEGKE